MTHAAEKIILALAIIFFAAPVCHSGSLLQIDADQQFQFAESSFKNSDYSQAIDEFKRFVYFFPQDRRVKEAEYTIALSWFFDKRMDKAMPAFEKIMDQGAFDEFTVKSYIHKSMIHERLREYGNAAVTLSNLAAIAESPEVRDEAHYRMGWVWLESMELEKSKKSFAKIARTHRKKYRIDSLSQSLEAGPGKKKSPLAAGLLSIIPGMGQLYCERYHDALVSFLLNAALGWSAWELFENDHNALGSLAAFLGIGFYSGNISSAATGAHKYNQRRARHFIDRLKQNLKINLSAGRQMDDLTFFVTYRF